MDPISDMLTIIRNAQAVRMPAVYIPFSKIKFEISKILKNEGFIESFEKKGRQTKKLIQINLKYDVNNKPVISGIRKISRPGQKIYVKKENIKPVKQGFGIAIISNSQGLMTNKEARKKGLGGEVICEVW